MRAVVQRVLEASVRVDDCPVSSIGQGLLVLAGFHHSDTEADLEYMIGKILNLRIFDDSRGIMNLSAADTGCDILLVSQFTLYGDGRKGNRPSYAEAMTSAQASPLFEVFTESCRSRHPSVKTGRFGADMTVSLINAGPVTILLDSKKQF